MFMLVIQVICKFKLRIYFSWRRMYDYEVRYILSFVYRVWVKFSGELFDLDMFYLNWFIKDILSIWIFNCKNKILLFS